jgi:hypothetical protein
LFIASPVAYSIMRTQQEKKQLEPKK